jgi:hypothetical protein
LKHSQGDFRLWPDSETEHSPVAEAIAMSTTGSPGSQTILDSALDIFRMRQHFDVVVRAHDMVAALRKDATFLHTVRRGLLPLPSDRRPAADHVFGPLPGTTPPPLTGRVGVVATGDSGALAALVGVARALQDSGTEVSVYSVWLGFGYVRLSARRRDAAR